MNSVRDGERKLPPGFRFQPTDEEIVFQYLSRKVFSQPLPAQIIPEIDVFGINPSELPGDSDQERYFFSKKGASSEAGGFWKAIGSAKRIAACSKKMPIVGIRRNLVFYKFCGKQKQFSSAVKTDWIMHEYCIAPDCQIIQRTNISQGCLTRIGDWALCRIFPKNRSTIADDDDDDDDEEYMSDADSSSASSSSSSIFTQVSSSYDTEGS